MDSTLDMKAPGILDPWLRADTEEVDLVWTKTRPLFASWSAWAMAHHGASCSPKAFTVTLRQLGFVIGRVSSGSTVHGLRLKVVPKKTAALKVSRAHRANPLIDAMVAKLDADYTRRGPGADDRYQTSR